MDYDKELEQRRHEEAVLQFEHFNNDDALALGLKAVEIARARKAAVVLEIEVNGIERFHVNLPGTNGRQCMWIRRKANTVRMAQISSYHAGQILKKNNNADIAVAWGMSRDEYTDLGGSFPIAIRGTGIIGCFTCSGLTQEEDHQLIVDAISAYLGAEL